MQKNMSANANPANSSITVTTVFGKSNLKPNDFVYVRLLDKYVKKPASELMNGEQVLFRKDGISNLTLEKVEEAMLKSERYVLSQGELFKKYGEYYMPVFYISLLSGMAQKSELWPSPIVSDYKIATNFASGRPIALSDAQKESAAVFIHEKLAEKGVKNPVSDNPVTINHIQQNWLSGSVIAPRGYVEVAQALLEIAPYMNLLLDDSFKQAHHTYIAIRQGVMRAVTNILFGKSSVKSDLPVSGRKNSAIHTKITPEIRLAIDHFASDVSTDFLSASVLEISKKPNQPNLHYTHNKTGANQNISACDERVSLFKGIVTEDICNDAISIKPMNVIAREYNSIEGLTLGITGNFILDNQRIIPAYIFEDKNALKNFLIITKFELSKVLGFRETHFRRISERVKELGISLNSYVYFPQLGTNLECVKFAKIFARDVTSGVMDAKFGLPYGSFLRVFEYESKLRCALPNDVLYASSLLDTIKAKKDRIAENEANYLHALKLNNGSKGSSPAHPSIIGHKQETKEVERLFKKKDIYLAVIELSDRSVPANEISVLLETIGIPELIKYRGRFFDFSKDNI